MVVVIRRMILLVAFAFWQGGFAFYGGVVVPVGTKVLGSGTEQGFITQPVTNYLNLAGAVCLLLWLEHLWRERRSGVNWLEWLVWGFATLSLLVLVVTHLQMDRFLIGESTTVLERGTFRLYHKLYIGTISLQWADCLLLLFLAVKRWHDQDQMK